MTREQTKSLILLAMPFGMALLLSAVLQYTILANSEAVEKWLEAFGLWFLAAYVVIQVLAIVIAPLGGLFAQLAAISILGPLKGILAIYLVSTPAFCINFLLARRFGRPLVLRVIGKTGMKKLDDVFADAGLGTLVILKIFQGAYFDYISYAAGLSTISFRDFVLVNFLGGIPYSIISYVIFSRSTDLIRSVVVLQILAAVLIAISIGINHYRHTKTPR